MSNDDKRKTIIAELSRRAEDSGAAQGCYAQMSGAFMLLLQGTGHDAVKSMALCRTMLRYAAMAAYRTVGTPMDLQIRTGDELAGMAEGLWDETCRNTEAVVLEFQRRGEEVPGELVKRTKLAPSDPKQRPDLPPSTPELKQERSNTLADIARSINTMGSRDN